MIHFICHYALDSDFRPTLRRMGVRHKIFLKEIKMNYRYRLMLAMNRMPKLFLFAMVHSFRSCVLSRPAPDFAIISSDMEAVAYILIKHLFFRSKTKIVFNSFIFTKSHGGFIDRGKYIFFCLIFKFIDLAIVHSRLEQERYSHLFNGGKAVFRFVPWGTTIDALPRLRVNAKSSAANNRNPIVVAAGRSKRDYATLFKAMETVDAELRVICDHKDAIPPLNIGKHTAILSNCHGDDYLQELSDATVVVIPLAEGDISAGQMVLIHAMGLGKAVIVTATPGIQDYVSDRSDAWLVPMGDDSAMRQAIEGLLVNDGERERMGRNAKDTYAQRFDTGHYLERIVDVLEEFQNTEIRRAFE
ncbi:MAG: glycosyltransferase [Acidobacteriota bacterium]|nr:glycosyltransferase [Acidobacteriota bacterium]